MVTAKKSTVSTRNGSVARFFAHFWEICRFSWSSLLTHWISLVFLFVFNVAFVFLFSFSEQPVQAKIQYTAQLIGDLFQHVVAAASSSTFLTTTQTDLANTLLNEPIFQRLIQDLFGLLLLLAALVYLLYTFFQSTSVRTIGWMVLDRWPYSLWTFVKLNTVWFIAYLLIRVIIFAADLAYAFLSNGKNMFADLTFLYVILHLLLLYFVFISYTFIADIRVQNKKVWYAVKSSLKAGTMHGHYYLLNFLPILLYIIPFTKENIIVPILNLLSPLDVVGMGLQLAVLFLVYMLYIANNFTITYELASTKISPTRRVPEVA